MNEFSRTILFQSSKVVSTIRWHKQSEHYVCVFVCVCVGMCSLRNSAYAILVQGLSQDLETGCLLKLAIVKFWASKVLIETTIYSYFNHKHV